MSAIDILYLILLIGSLAFGLEAMLIGLGGKLMVLYRRHKSRTLVTGLGVGLAIVVPAVIASIALTLEPIFFCALVLVCMLTASGVIKAFGAKSIRTPPPRPLPTPALELEVVDMLRKRGFGKLVKKKKSK